MCWNQWNINFTIFRVMVIFFTQTHQFSMNFHDNLKNKNRKIYFSFVSTHCLSFIKTESKLRGRRGVCISLVGKKPPNIILPNTLIYALRQYIKAYHRYVSIIKTFILLIPIDVITVDNLFFEFISNCSMFQV